MKPSPKLSSIKQCPCSSGKPFATCCARILIQQQAAKTPEQLMRSRFSAYFLGGFGDYLFDTWFPATAKNVSPIELSKKEHDWQRLDIISKSQKGDEGFVEFNAWFLEDEALQVLHEKSVFVRLQGRWLYVGGEVDSIAADAKPLIQ